MLTDQEANAAARTLCARFLEAWNGRDFEGVAGRFAEPAFFALPGAKVAPPDRPSLVALLGKGFSGREAEGFSHRVVGEIAARCCGEDMVIDGHCAIRRRGEARHSTVAVTCAPGWHDR